MAKKSESFIYRYPCKEGCGHVVSGPSKTSVEEAAARHMAKKHPQPVRIRKAVKNAGS